MKTAFDRTPINIREKRIDVFRPVDRLVIENERGEQNLAQVPKMKV